MDGHGGRIDGFYDPFGRSVALLAAWRTTTRERHATSTNGDSGRHARLAAHAAANPGRLPTRTRPETQQSGPHWPCRARVQICGADKRICDSIASLAA